MAISDDGYCLFHSRLGIDSEHDLVDKFNPQGFKSEIELFEHVWKDNKVCFVTGNKLEKYYGTDLWISCFAHILRKAKGHYPEFKLYTNNIVLLDIPVHELFDKGSLDKILKFEKKHNVSYKMLFELEKKLFEEYRKEFSEKKRKLRNIVEEYLSSVSPV